MTRLWIAVALAALAGCSDGGGGGSGGPLSPLRTIPFGFNVQAVGGHHRIVAGLAYNGDHLLPGYSPYQAILHLGERDPGVRTELLDRGTVILDAQIGTVNDVVVTSDWVTVVCDALVSAVSLGGAQPHLVATIPAAGTSAIASGRWLLAFDGTALRVRDLEDPLAPVVGSAFVTGSPVTALGLAPDGFHFFTAAGMGHVSMDGGAPQYSFAASEELRLFSKASLLGTKLYVGGPSRYLGKIRVARIDVSTPAAPVLEAFTDIEGALEDVAFDGVGAFVVLAQTPDYGTQTVVVAREEGSAFRAGGVRELPGVMRSAGATLHAEDGMFYAKCMSPYPYGQESLCVYATP